MKVNGFVTFVINSRALDKIPLSVHKVSKISKNHEDFFIVHISRQIFADGLLLSFNLLRSGK